MKKERIYFEINNKIFLLNEATTVIGKQDGSAFGEYYQEEGVTLHEMMDITREMEEGISNSFYTTDYSYFVRASKEKADEADRFLNRVGAENCQEKYLREVKRLGYDITNCSTCDEVNIIKHVPLTKESISEPFTCRGCGKTKYEEDCRDLFH